MGNMGTFNKKIQQVAFDAELLYHVGYLILCISGWFLHPFFFSVLLFDVVKREETLLNVMKSVTRNGRSIVLTAIFAMILVYLFSIVGYMFFRDDFLIDADRLPSSVDCTDTEPGTNGNTLLVTIVFIYNIIFARTRIMSGSGQAGGRRQGEILRFVKNVHCHHFKSRA